MIDGAGKLLPGVWGVEIVFVMFADGGKILKALDLCELSVYDIFGEQVVLRQG